VSSSAIFSLLALLIEILIDEEVNFLL